VLPHRASSFSTTSTRREQPSSAPRSREFEELPEGITIIVVSRSDPPPEFARLVASRRIARIDEAALRCTPQEAEAILGSQHLERQDLQRIHRQSDGWVAALVLLREHLSRHGAALDESLGEGKDAIFQYFAGEIFNGETSEPAHIDADSDPAVDYAVEAIALTGSEEAPDLLEYFYRRHLFTDRAAARRELTITTRSFASFFSTKCASSSRVTSDARRACAPPSFWWIAGR
jgi:ATP/maltotriose-dependent transcriptional regulator MalT